VIRLVARDTEVARRLARHVRDAGRRARVIAGPHDYGLQLDGQLRLAGLPRADAEDDADLVVLCGLPDGPEIAEARATAPLPIIAFDAVQGTDLGADREVRLALPFAPGDGDAFDWLTYGAERAGHGARLIAAALADGAHDRPTLLDHLRRAGPFDAHGDPVDPPVWLWRAQPDRSLRPDRAI
jgi:hypothetical protein